MVRLAVGIWPSSEVMEALGRLDRPPVAGARWSRPEQWLVKIRPLGHVDPRLVSALVEALGTALGGWPPVECTIGPATRRLGGQWLGAPVAGLDALAAVVFAVTAPIVPVTHPQPFQANIVLARGRVPTEVAGDPIALSWTADAVSLVADRSSPGAARHEELARLPLRG